MEPLTLNDLKKHQSGVTSVQVGRSLFGVLTVVTTEDDEYPRGTILLLDLESQEPVPCLIDRMLPTILGSAIFIKQWNYVHLNEGEGAFYLEFRLIDVYPSAKTKKSSLKEQLGNDETIFKNFVARKKLYYIPKDGLEASNNVNIAGVVYSISTLYANPGSEAMFFLQITCHTNADTTGLKAINLIFSGNDKIKFYRYFQIGGAFAFHNLSAETINSSRRNPFFMLSFKEGSQCQAIKLSGLQNINVQLTANQISADMLTAVNVHKHKTYTGRITRVIDSMFGIYELNNNIIVCLFHLFSYSANMPFRIDTRLRLHHFHAALINPEDGETSHLLDGLWQANKSEEGYMALAACIQSHIEILEFPKHCNDFVETAERFFLPENTNIGSKIKEYTYTDIISRKSTFTQLLRQLEIYAALTAKFVDTNIVNNFHVFKRAYMTVRDQVFATTKTRPMQAGDLVNDFVLHDTVCLLVGKETSRIVIDSHPSLDQIKKKMEANLQDYRLDLAGGNTMFERENVLTQRAEYDQTAEYCIMGTLQVAKDGRLYLVDSESKILFVLASPSGLISKKPGEIYLIRRLQLFREDLSFVENEDQELIKRKDLFVTYVVCQEKDLLLLDEDHSDYVVFHSPPYPEIQNKQLEKFSLVGMPLEIQHLPENDQYLAVRVINRYPVEACFTPTGSVYLECRVIVHMYQIEGLGLSANLPEYLKTTAKQKYALVFSSLKQSLHLHNDFQIGTHWIISGLDKPGSQIAGVENTLTFAFSIDVGKHVICPLSFSQGASDKVQLRPHFGNTDIRVDPTSLVYNVSELKDILKPPPGLTGNTTPVNYFVETVHVQGVVIIKRFMEGFTTHGTLNKHAAKLYDCMGVSSGKPHRKLFLQLRQPDSLDTISIYMDIHKVHYPAGLVLGATVTFHNLIRKKKASANDEFFFLADSSTSIHVNNTTPSPNVISMKPACIKTRLISSFHDTVLGIPDQTSKQIFKLYCYVNSIINLTLKWECRDCGSIVRKNDCFGMCQDASRIFSVHAFVQITDGTGNANASIDGERLVFSLLRLTPNQIDALKNLVLDYGQLSFGGWGTNRVTTMDDEDERMKYNPEKVQRKAMHGYTLQDLCNNAKRVGQFYIYGQVQSIPNRKRAREEDDDIIVDENLIEEFKLRKFKISDNGSLLKTAELSKIRIKVAEIAFPDAKMVAYEMLDQLNEIDEAMNSLSSLPTPLAASDFE